MVGSVTGAAVVAVGAAAGAAAAAASASFFGFFLPKMLLNFPLRLSRASRAVAD